MPETRSRSKTRPTTADVPIGDQDELVPVHRPTTPGFKICFALLVVPCYLVTPVSFYFAFRHLYLYRQWTCLPSHSRTYTFWYYQSLCEIAFFLFFRFMVHKAQARKSHPLRDPAFLSDLLVQCLSVGVPIDHAADQRRPKLKGEPDWNTAPLEALPTLRQKLRKWFHNAPLSTVKADNVREWLAWAVAGGRTLEEAREDEHASKLVDDGFAIVQKRLRHTFPAGYNPEVRTVRLTLDPVRTHNRPLAYYVVCNGMTLATYFWLVAFKGFRFRSSHGLQFLVLPPGKSKKHGLANGHANGVANGGAVPSALPIVFLHGLGIGLAQYVAFLKPLSKTTAGAVIMLQPNISTQIFHPRFLDPPPNEDYVKAIEAVCSSLDIDKATILSHSNGTMVHGWLLRGCPKLCYRNILVDPVCFRLWEGDVCYTFLWQRWRTAMNALLGYFVARELGTAHSISRDFQWVDMVLWEHELPSVEPDRLRIVIGTDDSLIDTASVVDYLSECGVPAPSVKVIQGHNHGQSLIVQQEGMKEVLEAIA